MVNLHFLFALWPPFSLWNTLFTILILLLIFWKFWCRKKGIMFVAIDQNRPLSDQGPFDIVLHKVCLFKAFLRSTWLLLFFMGNICCILSSGIIVWSSLSLMHILFQLTGKEWRQILEVRQNTMIAMAL